MNLVNINDDQALITVTIFDYSTFYIILGLFGPILTKFTLYLDEMNIHSMTIERIKSLRGFP